MTDQHPITPPPELVREWAKTCSPYEVPADHIATQAANWGSDQELEACCAWLKANDNPRWALALQEGRRPNPLSLKEQSLALIDKIQGSKEAWNISDLNVIRRALEQLDD